MLKDNCEFLTEQHIKKVIKETINEILFEYADNPDKPGGGYNTGRLYMKKRYNKDSKGAELIQKLFHDKIMGMSEKDRKKMEQAFRRGVQDQDEYMSAKDGMGKTPADVYQYERPMLDPISSMARQLKTGRTIKNNLDKYSKNKLVPPVKRRHKVH